MVRANIPASKPWVRKLCALDIVQVLSGLRLTEDVWNSETVSKSLTFIILFIVIFRYVQKRTHDVSDLECNLSYSLGPNQGIRTTSSCHLPLWGFRVISEGLRSIW